MAKRKLKCPSCGGDPNLCAPWIITKKGQQDRILNLHCATCHGNGWLEVEPTDSPAGTQPRTAGNRKPKLANHKRIS